MKEELINTFRGLLLSWYQENGRRFPWRYKSTSKYKLIVTEVLLQRTKAETIAKMYHTFFSQYPSWKSLSSASEEELNLVLQPIGLWKRRSKLLSQLSSRVVSMNGRFPKEREALEALPNVGQYIANAILLFCHNSSQPLLDTNMARVLERVFGPRLKADIRYDPYLQKLAYEVVNTQRSIELNWAILDFASIVCRNYNPRCRGCVLVSICLYFEQNNL
jgi:A/G-specific adenine glycosylase